MFNLTKSVRQTLENIKMTLEKGRARKGEETPLPFLLMLFPTSAVHSVSPEAAAPSVPPLDRATVLTGLRGDLLSPQQLLLTRILPLAYTRG